MLNKKRKGFFRLRISKDVFRVRKGLFCIFLLMLLLQNPLTGKAANWVNIAESTSGSSKITRYVDADSIQTTKVGTREVWLKTTFDPPDITTDHLGQKAQRESALSFLTFTSEKYLCVRKLVEYYTDGKSSSVSSVCEFTKVVPDTVGEAVWEYLFK